MKERGEERKGDGERGDRIWRRELVRNVKEVERE